MEEKGLLKRLAAFWKEDGPTMGGGFRRLWQFAGGRKAMREGRGLAREGRDQALEGETAGLAAEKRFGRDAAGNRGTRAQRFSFLAGFREAGAGLPGTEGTPEGRRKEQAFFAAAANRRAEETAGQESRTPPIWAAGTEGFMPARAFSWGEPEEAGRRKRAPAAGLWRKERRAKEESAGGPGAVGPAPEDEAPFFRKTEGQAAEGRKAAMPDIDGLMREMAKRLWEEREGCGRRLGG